LVAGIRLLAFQSAYGIFVSALLAIAVAIWKSLKHGPFGKHPFGVGVLFLPFAALCGVGIDLIRANRAAVASMLIARILLPATTLIMVLGAGFGFANFTSTIAILCYGADSIAGVIYCAIAFFRSAPNNYSPLLLNIIVPNGFHSAPTLRRLVFQPHGH